MSAREWKEGDAVMYVSPNYSRWIVGRFVQIDGRNNKPQVEYGSGNHTTRVYLASVNDLEPAPESMVEIARRNRGR